MDTETREAIWYPGHWASIDPGRAAVVDNATGETMTYGELDSFAMRFARALRRCGLEPGDHIAWCMENRLEFLAVAWGGVYAGLHYTTISHTLHAEEIAYIVNDCGAKALVVTPHKAREAAGLRELVPGVEHRFTLGGDLDGYERLEPVLAAEPDDPMDDLVEGVDMLYSSGTTGQPKGVKVPLPGDPLGTKPALLAMCELLFGFFPLEMMQIFRVIVMITDRD